MEKADLEIIKSTYEKGREFIMDDQALTFDRLEGDDIIALNTQGEEVRISVRTEKPIINPAIENATDGIDDSPIVTNNENKLDAPEGRGNFNGAKVISTNRGNGEKFDFVSQDYLDYERTPRDKKGEKVNFEINNVRSNSDWVKALNAINSNDFSNKELLYNFLPINIKFTDNISSPLETLPKGEEAQQIFKETTLPLRKVIIDHLSNGGNIDSISSIIEGQYEGSLRVQDQIQLADGTILTPENSLLDLQILKGLEKDKQLEYLVDNLYMVNWTGQLENVVNSEKLIPTNYTGKGEIYFQIPMNNGKPFNLKLNFKRIESAKGEAVYELLKMISASSADINNPIGRDTTLGEVKVVNEELYNSLFNDEIGILKSEVELYTKNSVKVNRKNKDSVTLNDILDILVFKDSTNTKTLLHVDVNGNLNLGSLSIKSIITRTELEENSAETRQIVLDFLKNKRYNVLVTRGAKGINFNNPSYLNYILDNSVLSTNAVVNEPTFQGYSNIYISNDSKDIKIEQEVSTSNLTPEEIEQRISEESNEFIESKIGKNASTLAKLNATRKYAPEIEIIKNKYNMVNKEVNNIYTPTEEEIVQVEKVIDNNTPIDVVDVSDNIIEELVDRLGTITSDVTEALSKDTNKEIYSELVKLANQREINIEDIQKRCK